MSQIICKECNTKINEKSLYCSNCGTKIEKNNPDLIKLTIKKEKTTILTYLLNISLFIIFILLISSNLNFLTTIRQNLTLQQLQYSSFYEGILSLFPSIIINLSFISCILNIISKKYQKLTRSLYAFNIITCLLLYIYIYTNNYRIDICYYLIIVINNILLLLPSFNKVIETEIEIDKKNIEKEEIKNEKINKLFTKKKISKKQSLLYLSFFTLELLSIILIIYFNSKDIYKETIVQTNSEFQIEIINDYINIRKEANTESEILGEVNKGDIYNVLEIYGGENYIWYKIDYKGTIGYIASDRKEPYIKELYKDFLVVNIFCTEEKKNCAYILDYIYRIRKTSDTYFLINYLDIKDEYTKEIYFKAIEYYDDARVTPYIIIGNTNLKGYNDEVLEEIENNISNKTSINIVDEIKKGNELPKLNKKEE